MNRRRWVLLGVVFLLAACAGGVTPLPATRTPENTARPRTPTASATVRVRATETPLPTPTPTPPDNLQACVTARSLRVRAGPGTDYALVGGLVAGNCLAVDARSQDGAWVRFESGDWQGAGRGWVSAAHVEVQGDLFALPVATADPPAP